MNDIISINKKGKKVASLEEYIEEVTVPDKELFSNVVGQDSLTRFDKPKQTTKNRTNKNRNKSKNRNKKSKTNKNA